MVTSAVAKLQPDHCKSSYPYFSHPDQNQGIGRRTESFRKWNPETTSKAGHLERVEYLRSDPMLGYLLVVVVVKHWNKAKAAFGDPILRVVLAAPSMMMCYTTAFTHDMNDRVEGSLIAEDIWSPTPAFMATSEPLSLLMAAGGDFLGMVRILPPYRISSFRLTVWSFSQQLISLIASRSQVVSTYLAIMVSTTRLQHPYRTYLEIRSSFL
jgi:hypothetical protein